MFNTREKKSFNRKINSVSDNVINILGDSSKKEHYDRDVFINSHRLYIERLVSDTNFRVYDDDFIELQKVIWYLGGTIIWSKNTKYISELEVMWGKDANI